MTLEFSQEIFKTYSNIKLCETPASVSQVVPDLPKLTVAFRNFTNVPKNQPMHGRHNNTNTVTGLLHHTTTVSMWHQIL
jgi:hypothetical protein